MSTISADRRFRIVQILLVAILANSAAAGERGYRAPRQPYGHPDLEGSWDHTDLTPLERPQGFPSLIVDASQAAQIEKQIDNAFEDRSTPTEPTEFFNTRRMQPIRGQFHSSIIVDPENGQLPWLPAQAEWGKRTRQAVLAAMDGPEQRPNSERCLGNPAAQPPIINNPGTNLHQIVQTKDTVIFASEWMGNARIIRLNGTHAPAAVTSWLGDSIGRWEGDTLVVETKNFTNSDHGRVGTPNAFMVSSRATVVERFKRVSRDELSYAFTVEDPEYYRQTWKGESHFMRTDDRLLEYSCHEGNRSLVYILQGARVKDGQWR